MTLERADGRADRASDRVFDRLIAAAAWQDPRALEQAKLVATHQAAKID